MVSLVAVSARLLPAARHYCIRAVVTGTMDRTRELSAARTMTPADPPLTDDTSTAVLAALQGLGVAFETLECDPALADTADFCRHYDVPLANSANVIVVAGKSEPRQYAACVLLADTRLDVNKRVRKTMGVRRISFASAEETRMLTGMEIGGVTALGLPESLPLWVDQRVMRCDYIILGGGNRSLKLKLSPEVFHRTPNTTVVEGLALAPDEEKISPEND